MIAAVVRDGLMPPSHGVAGGLPQSVWKSPVEMPEQDRADLIAWLSSDRPLGNTGDLPRKTPREQAWTLGTPDQFLMTETMKLGASGAMMHQRFPIPTSMSEDLMLRAIEMRPMKLGTIDRAVAWVVPAGVAAPREGEEISNVAGVELFGTYSPGHGFVEFPSGTARRLKAGSTVVVDVYARPMGKVMGVAMRIGLYVRGKDAGVTRELKTKMVMASSFALAAGEAGSRTVEGVVLEENVRVMAMTPSMGPRGKELRLSVGTESRNEVLKLDRFDSRWAIRYELREGMPLGRGINLKLEGEFDNSEANPSNPMPGDVAKSGAGATEESLWVSVEYVAE